MLDAQIKLGDLVHIKPKNNIPFWRTGSVISMVGFLYKDRTYTILSLAQIKKLPYPYKVSGNSAFYFHFYYNGRVYHVMDYDLHVLDFVVRK